MGKLSRNQIIAMVIGALVVAGVIVTMVIANAKAGEKDPVPAPLDTSIATQTPTATATPSQAPQPVPTTNPATLLPTPTASALGEYPPSVSPDIKIITIDGFGDSDNLEANVTPDEIALRNKVYQVIPVYENLASPYYKTPTAARDELLSKGLITQNMADTQFPVEFNEYQNGIRAAEFSIQTTGMRCMLRGISSATVFDLGKINCYYTRTYLTKTGGQVSKQQFVNATQGGVGAIDSSEQARLVLTIKEENGEWKIDSIRNG